MCIKCQKYTSVYGFATLGTGMWLILQQPCLYMDQFGWLYNSDPSPSPSPPGLLAALQGSVVMTVVMYLLGGGNSFSSGGPGKGMHSRLYTRVLNYHHWVHSCSSYSNTFNNTGLFGIQASCDPPKAQHMLDVMCGT